MHIVAKPIIDKQFYILTKDNQKIGNIEATDQGYNVRIDNQITNFKTLSTVRKKFDIEFEVIGNQPDRRPDSYQVQGYPSGSRVYNPIWDVKHRLPLFTKTKKSRSWFAAGWYCVKQKKDWEVIRSPKLITLQRYPYHGPYHTNDEALSKKETAL